MICIKNIFLPKYGGSYCEFHSTPNGKMIVILINEQHYEKFFMVPTEYHAKCGLDLQLQRLTLNHHVYMSM